MNVSRFFLTILLTMISLPVFAADVDLRLLLEEARLKNPDIQATQQNAEAARERIPQAKALDDPKIGIMFDDVPIDTANVKRAEEIDYRIEQTLPFPGKRLTQKNIARWEAEAASQEANVVIQNVLFDVKKTYYDLFRVERSLDLNRENQKLLHVFASSAKTNYASGKTDATPVLKADIEVALLQSAALRLEQERITHQAHLKALLGREHHEDIVIPTSLSIKISSISLKELSQDASTTRPELTRLASKMKGARSRLTTSKQSLLPDLTLSFQYGDRPSTQQDTWTGSAMINLPIFFWGKNRHAIREARSMLKASEATYHSMQLHTEHEIKESLSAIESAATRTRLYEREILPRAKAAFEAAKTLYASGKKEGEMLIDAAKAYRELRIQYHETQSEWGIAIAMLEQLLGKEFSEEGEQP